MKKGLNLYNQIKNGKKTFIIAEAGVNHNGHLDLAKQLVDAAQEAGCDAVKFQTFKAGNLISKYAPKAEYQKETTGQNESQLDMVKKLELSQDDHKELLAYCVKKNILFLSTPFEKESANFLESLKIPLFKIPSGAITNLPFLKHIAKKGKPIILSTGMSTLAEVKEAVKTIKAEGNKNIVLLHCVTSYPALAKEVNLKAMLTMKRIFNLPVGFSDHTLGVEVAVAAVYLGARVIEKHFTLDKNNIGPDHKASLDPKELKELVRRIRDVEKAIKQSSNGERENISIDLDELKRLVPGIRDIEKVLGNGIKRPSKGEKKNIPIARESVVAKTDLSKGSIISAENITIKRPAPKGGIQPKDITKLFGRKVRCHIKEDQVLRWKDVL